MKLASKMSVFPPQWVLSKGLKNGGNSMSVCVVVFAGKELLPHKVSAVSFIHKKSVRKETHVHLDSEVSV